MRIKNEENWIKMKLFYLYIIWIIIKTLNVSSLRAVQSKLSDFFWAVLICYTIRKPIQNGTKIYTIYSIILIKLFY